MQELAKWAKDELMGHAFEAGHETTEVCWLDGGRRFLGDVNPTLPLMYGESYSEKVMIYPSLPDTL